MRRVALFSYTASALTMMRSSRVGRKVGCHRAVVEMFRIVSAVLSQVNESDGIYRFIGSHHSSHHPVAIVKVRIRWIS